MFIAHWLRCGAAWRPHLLDRFTALCLHVAHPIVHVAEVVMGVVVHVAHEDDLARGVVQQQRVYGVLYRGLCFLAMACGGTIAAAHGGQMAEQDIDGIALRHDQSGIEQVSRRFAVGEADGDGLAAEQGAGGAIEERHINASRVGIVVVHRTIAVA